MRPLRATYRLQLRPGFGFDEAAALVPYLAKLGISHLYLSPISEAVAGSTHGYDVVDHKRIRAELGGPDGLERLRAAAHEHGLGLVIDIVPNHMAVVPENRWWWDVLEHGPRSQWADRFDIDWESPEPRLRGVVVLPVLGDHFGRELEAGRLRLELDGSTIVARYLDHVAPLSPETTADVFEAAALAADDDEFGFVARSLRTATAQDDPEARRADLAVARRLLRPHVDRHPKEVDAALALDPHALGELLDKQHHRFVRWQVAQHELDYRRFFDVSGLVGLRVDRAPVFDDVHRLVAQLAIDGVIDGVRVDHVDGLRDPEGYVTRLRSLLGDEQWILVEKILHGDEHIPGSWPVDGTTGYDFGDMVGAVLVDPAGESVLTEAWRATTDVAQTYAEVTAESRRLVLESSLGGELERVVELLVRVCERHPRWRDFTRNELRAVVVALAAHAPGYRSYVRAGHRPSIDDERFVADALRSAAVEGVEADLLSFVGDLWLGRVTGEHGTAFVLRFQQLLPAVVAKGDEDTALYRWNPLLARNEVGSDPSRFAMTPSEFHHVMAGVAKRSPHTMTATSTHDSKRSEDVRARLALLSEIPERWSAFVRGWRERNARHWPADADPDAGIEWFVYQTIVGAHPISFERLWPPLEKSLREAKLHTSWLERDARYETAVHAFVSGILADDGFRAEVDSFVGSIEEPGRVNALAQRALQLVAPGVPDTYQGCELWTDSLVDPDNRRPVDFEVRAAALGEVEQRTPVELWTDDDARRRGLPKLALLRAALTLRRDYPAMFETGDYEPMTIAGDDPDRIVGFIRGGTAAVAVPRLPLASRPVEEVAQPVLPDGRWRSVLTDAVLAGGSPQRWGDVVGGFPVALLVRER